MNLPPAITGDGGIVGDEDNGNTPFIELLQDHHYFETCTAIEVAGGFVGQDNGGPRNQRAGDGHALLLPTGKFRRAMIGSRAQAYDRQCLPRPLATLQRRRPAVDEREFDVGKGCHARQEVEALKDEADFLIANGR